MLKKLYDLQIKIYGAHDKRLIRTLLKLEEGHYDLKDYNQSIKFRKILHSLYLEIYGETHKDSIISLTNMAHTYRHLGEFPSALVHGY